MRQASCHQRFARCKCVHVMQFGESLLPAPEPYGQPEQDDQPCAENGEIERHGVRAGGSHHGLPEQVAQVGQRHDLNDGFEEAGEHVGGNDTP